MMVVNSIRRILIAVVLCLGLGGLGAGVATADDTGTDTGATNPFTPPYCAP
jgi:hypothetical protein